jgi:hypothetical protein
MWRWIQSVVVAASLLPVSVWANPFASFPLLPSGETMATGKTLFTLENGDYVQPHFSPDSRYLAFAREVLEGSTELTEILALDLKTLKVKTLLDAKASREFAMYRSYVAGFSWKDATTLKASISDGDVNGVDLIIDAAAGRLVEKKPISLVEPHGDSSAGFAAVFPSIPPPVLDNALDNGFKVGNKKYVVQKNYWKQDNHIWLLDAESRQMVKLIEIPDAWIYSLRGAFTSGDALILLVAYGPEAYLVRHSGGKLELLYRFPVKNYQQVSMHVEPGRGDRTLFQIITGPSYEKRENYFFLYDKAGLKKIKDVTAIYDLDVDNAGKLVCFSQWKNDKRILVVRELRNFR